MTTAEILIALRDGLAADATLKAWCETELGAAPTIQLGFDDEGEVDAFPMIAVTRPLQTDGVISPRQAWSFAVLCLAKNPDRTTATTAGCKTITYDGLLEVEGLREQAVAALFRLKLGQLKIRPQEIDHTYHPRYVAAFILDLEKVKNFST